MAAVGVPGTTREKAAMVRPMSTVLTTSTRRKPKRASRWVEMSFMVIAAAALGMISRPDCQAGRPRPICKSSGSMKGMPPMPVRVMKPPTTETRKVRMRKRARRKSGHGLRCACQP